MSDIAVVIVAILFFIVGLLGMLFMTLEDITMAWDTQQLVETCQQDLPRNQYCTIKAVAAEEKL